MGAARPVAENLALREARELFPCSGPQLDRSPEKIDIGDWIAAAVAVLLVQRSERLIDVFFC